jgi:KUP system potassium uptake protein
LSIIATVIASQAMISGIFSIVYQGITTNIMPKLRVEYTSRKLRSQIYIPFVNWFLLCFVLLAILEFKQSYNLANAYGLAASCTMTITSILMLIIFTTKGYWIKAVISCVILALNLLFLVACTTKIPYGAYWSILIAMIPLGLIIINLLGKRKLSRSLRPISLQTFLERYETTYKKVNLIQGTGLFFSKGIRRIPPYVIHTMFTNNIIYEDNIIVSVITKDKPFGIVAAFKEDLAAGLRVFEIRMGYMEIMNIEKILRTSYIDPKVMFYGMEDIETKNIFWKVFALIKKLTPSFVQFYKLPSHKLHGVVMRVEM